MAGENRLLRGGAAVGRLIILMCALVCAVPAAAGPAGGAATPAAARSEADGPRKRIRALGIVVGRMAPGPLNAITDVKGVRVGQVTLNRGEGKLPSGVRPVRTGGVGSLPHGGELG